MIKPRLSYPQRQVLKALNDNGAGCNRSCTNSTLSALERRGLVELTWLRLPGDRSRELWVVTDAGKEWLAS
jgi:hypothetical protein